MVSWKDSTAKSNAKTLPRKCPSALMVLSPTQRPKLLLKPHHQPQFPPQPQNLSQLVSISLLHPHPAGSCEPFFLPNIPICWTTNDLGCRRVCVCGQRQRLAKIICPLGPNECKASRGSVPWQAALVRRRQWSPFCGGTLISDRYTQEPDTSCGHDNIFILR